MTPPATAQSADYLAWLKRQYVKATESQTADTTPPTVAGVTPASGASNVSLGTSVSATFSEAISSGERDGDELCPARRERERRHGVGLGERVDRDAAAERDARALDDVHGDPAGRLERDQGSGRECARLELQLVVHDVGSGHDAADRGGCDSGERRVERQSGDGA